MFQRPPARAGAGPSGFVEERIRTPRRHEGEMYAIVVEQMGGSRMTVQCEDGKQRLARIPGRVRRKLWIKEGDYLVIKPWDVQGDERCDLEFRYTLAQADTLKRRGLLKM